MDKSRYIPSSCPFFLFICQVSVWHFVFYFLLLQPKQIVVTSDLFKLSTASDCWDIWFKDDVTGGEVTVTADINAMTWKYE